MIKEEGKEWTRHPATNVKMFLQSLDQPKNEAEAIMGGAVGHSWKLVSLPFREEYPGGRQWNLDAAQFKYKPAELADDEVPHHPHWDMIFDHIGHELTPVLRELPWAVEAKIRTGADYLRAWVACAFRDPFQPLPYLFFFGPEGSGKSIFYESLQRLVTKGVVKAERSLTSEFNGELSGAIICAVEETDISKAPGAHAKIKEYVTTRTMLIRKMRHDCFAQPNTTHWVQTANSPKNCPVFPGDTRITMVRVNDLLEEQKIAKLKMEAFLDQEAAHFLRTLMHLELPPVIDRLRLPVVTTASKLSAQEDNRTDLEQFIAECCEQTPDRHYPFAEFYDRFQQWLPINEKHVWSKKRVANELPIKHHRFNGTGNKLYVSNLTLKPAEKEKS
jgi:phage/plasmid-associated DNA primase